jgi:hypothetical protein
MAWTGCLPKHLQGAPVNGLQHTRPITLIDQMLSSSKIHILSNPKCAEVFLLSLGCMA